MNNAIIENFWSKIKHSQITQKMTWAFLGTAASKLLILVGGIFVARFLDKEVFGEFSIVRSTINMFIIFGSSGIGITATKYVSEYAKQQRDRILPTVHSIELFSLLLGIVLVVAIFCFSEVIAVRALHAPHLTFPLQVGAIILFFTVVNACKNGILVGFNKFRTLAYNTLWGGIVEAAGMMLGAYYFGLIGAIMGFGIGVSIIYLLNAYSVKKVLRSYRTGSPPTSARNSINWRIFSAYTLPSTLSSALVLPMFWVVKSMLVQQYSFSELASFEVAEQWKNIILFIPTAISQVVLPELIQTQQADGSDSGKSFWRVLQLNLSINFFTTAVLCLCFISLSSFILRLYGSSYTDIWTLNLLCISTIPIACSGVVGLSLASRSKMWIGFLFNLIWAVCFLSFSWIFLKQGMGAMGTSLALLTSYTFHTIFQFIYLRNQIQ